VKWYGFGAGMCAEYWRQCNANADAADEVEMIDCEVVLCFNDPPLTVRVQNTLPTQSIQFSLQPKNVVR